MNPIVTAGGIHTDLRGTLLYNNDFDLSLIRRMYVIENLRTDFVRAWQGHQIEQRWFSAISGSFKIQLIEINNWELPSKDCNSFSFIINANKLDVLHIPKGYVSSIQSLEEGAKLLVMSDYLLGEIQDEYRYEVDYFV